MEKPESFYGYFLEQVGEAFDRTGEFKVTQIHPNDGRHSKLIIKGPNSVLFDFFFYQDSTQQIRLSIHGSTQTKFYGSMDLNDPETTIDSIVDTVKYVVLKTLAKKTINQYYNQLDYNELVKTASTLSFTKRGSTQRALNKLLKKWSQEWQNRQLTSSK